MPPVVVTGGAMLSALILCGILGMLGQGIRAAIGLKNANALASTTPGQQSQFSAAYFGLSMMIGFIAGVLAGFGIGLDNFIHNIDPNNVKIMLGVIAAGYAGADFIENAMSVVIPGGTAPPPAAPPVIIPPSSGLSQIDARVTESPLTLVSADAKLAAALKIASPRLAAPTWMPALSKAFAEHQINNNRRVAAAIGQFLVEAGSTFEEIVENLNYTTPERLMVVWPRLFPDVAAAQPYVRDPTALANHVYANRLGNGDEASGDGYRFRGRGLIQLTGRDEYTEFGVTHGITADEAAALCETPEGAALSGCWYLFKNNCLPLADKWSISAITRAVNGSAMLNNELRIKYSNTMLKALGG